MTPRKPILSADAAAFVRGDEQPASASQEPTKTLESPNSEARVRFTVDLPRSLHRRLKLAALEKEVPMTDLARMALAEWLDSLTD